RCRHDLYYENWDFDIQQQLPRNFLARFAYIGSQGHDLFQSRATNLIDPATGKRPLPQFGQFGIKHNDANSNFHAFQISLKRSFSRGFLWDTEYQWSHAMADGSIGAGEGIALDNWSWRA